MKINNTVIKCLTPEHGKEIIQWFRSQGVDTREYTGKYCETKHNYYFYYGVINNHFNNYSIDQVKAANAKIIELSRDEFDMTTNDGRLAYAKKYYTIGTEFLNTKGEFRKVIGIPRIYSGTTIEIPATGEHGVVIFNPNIYSEEHGWCKIIKQEEKVMEKQKLSRAGLKEIHGVACSNWKITLEQFGSRNPLEDYIELLQEEVNIMFAACTENQLPIVSKYLKQDDGSVDVMQFRCDIYDKEGRSVIQKRFDGEYARKSLLLDHYYNWEIKEDELGYSCLIPTKKK